jgi:hypothetical protein
MLGRGEPAGQGKPDDVLQFGRERPERPERRGRLGRLDPRWRSRAIVACLVLVTALIVGLRFGLGSGHRPSGPGSRSGNHRAHHRANKPIPVRLIATGHPLLGVTGRWQLLARGPNELLRIQLAKGRITWTYVPPLQTTSQDVAFVPVAHETIIRPADFVPGYLVPDGARARLLTGPLASGSPLVPGVPGSGTAWVPPGPPTSAKLSLIEPDGNRAGPVIRFPRRGPQLPETAVPDGRGDVLVASSGFSSYDAGPTWDRPVPGSIIAVGPTGWLTVICTSRGRCRTEFIDSGTGARRALSSASKPAPYFFSWPPVGVIAPDGATAAVVGRVVAGQAKGPTNAVRLIDLRTGVAKDLGVRIGGHDSLPAGTSIWPESMAWSPDSRWLFVAGAGGRLLAIDARSGQIESLGITLPRVEQVAVRP